MWGCVPIAMVQRQLSVRKFEKAILETILACRWEGIRSFWKVPKFPLTSTEVPRRLPRNCSIQRFPKSFPNFPESSRDLPRGKPLSLTSLARSDDSQKVPLSCGSEIPCWKGFPAIFDAAGKLFPGSAKSYPCQGLLEKRPLHRERSWSFSSETATAFSSFSESGESLQTSMNRRAKQGSYGSRLRCHNSILETIAMMVAVWSQG